MTTIERARIVFHGGIVLFVGLLCGYPAVSESIAGGENVRLWHTAHEALIMIAMLMFALASVVPLLGLGRRQASGLVWSLLASGYGFMVGLIVGGMAGIQAFGPSRSPAAMIAFAGNAVGIVSSMLAALLTILGARESIARARTTAALRS